VFVDIDEATYNIDVEQVAAAMTERTKAVIPVHLYGQPANLDPLLALTARHGAAVVEDTAQAFGAVYGDRQAGTLGACGTYSFFPTKPLGGVGDGGLTVTSDPAVADRLRMLRVHGARRRYAHEIVGYNSRLDTVQAAVLRLKLRRVDDANKARQRVAQHYDARFADMAGLVSPFVAPGRTHVYHVYTVRILGGRRDAVRAALERRGIASMVYYPVPVHRLPVYAGETPSLPKAERAAAEVLSLPISPVLGEEAVDAVADTVLGALTGAK
jgi:dTDP-4-amino-4,6-dideoxygalactose transaminase